MAGKSKRKKAKDRKISKAVAGSIRKKRVKKK